MVLREKDVLAGHSRHLYSFNDLDDILLSRFSEFLTWFAGSQVDFYFEKVICI